MVGPPVSAARYAQRDAREGLQVESVAWLEPTQAGCAGGGARPCIRAARSAYAMHMRTDIWIKKSWFLKDLAVPGRAVLVAVQGSCDSLIAVMTCQ